MSNELVKIENILFNTALLKISNGIEDREAKDYFGCDFETEGLKFKFRKSKITPKKNGQFVTFWKRNLKNETEPFNETDVFDFYMILCEEHENYGFFIFPKAELIKKQLLSTKLKEGKRGFRVYPTWTITESNQATKTKVWQNAYFFDFTTKNIEVEKRLIKILENK